MNNASVENRFHDGCAAVAELAEWAFGLDNPGNIRTSVLRRGDDIDVYNFATATCEHTSASPDRSLALIKETSGAAPASASLAIRPRLWERCLLKLVGSRKIHSG